MVLEAVGGVYRIRLHDGSEANASLRGRLKREERTGDRVVAGDLVITSPVAGDAAFTIERVLPRISELVRAGPGGRGARVAAANLEQCLVVLSAADTPFDPEVADRFLILAESCGIPPLLVMNKVDLAGARAVAEEAGRIYGLIGYEVLLTSVMTREGLDRLTEVTGGTVSVLIGPSGAGKSSLLNSLDSRLALRTGAVGARSGRGRHTTVSARMLELPHGGWVADTPGFSDVRLWGVAPSSLGPAFPEFSGPAEGCRFRGCSHIHEPGCGVKEALEDRRIVPSRYASYVSMYRGDESQRPRRPPASPT